MARAAYSSTIETDVLRDLLRNEIALPSLQQAGKEQKQRLFQSYIDHTMHALLLSKAKESLATLGSEDN